MNRAEITQLCEREVLDTASRLFDTSKAALGKFDDYEGCANLVYHNDRNGQPRILRCPEWGFCLLLRHVLRADQSNRLRRTRRHRSHLSPPGAWQSRRAGGHPPLWCFGRDGGLCWFRPAVLPGDRLQETENLASQRVIQKCGMTYLETIHLWGIELVRQSLNRE